MNKTILDALISNAKGQPLQVRLKHDPNPNPIGPGTVEAYPGLEAEGVYRMFTPAMMQTPAGPKKLTLPLVMTAESILWIAEAPINEDDEPAIVVPGSGRTSGGLVIPGRSS